MNGGYLKVNGVVKLHFSPHGYHRRFRHKSIQREGSASQRGGSKCQILFFVLLNRNMTVNAKCGFDVHSVNSFLIGGEGGQAGADMKVWC